MLRRTFLPGVVSSLALTAAPSTAPSTDETAVLKAEESFRLAKLSNDTAALQHILADQYTGFNQYGVKRNKQELIALFGIFKLDSLKPSELEVRLAGDVAVLTGSQIEINPGGKETHLFTRVYLRQSDGWRLLTSTQLIPFTT